MNDGSRTLCRRLNDRIREVAPEGLGRWPAAWELVEDPSDVFLDRLREWKRSDTPATRARLNEAATALVDAWKRAAQKWEAAGRPSTREGVPV